MSAEQNRAGLVAVIEDAVSDGPGDPRTPQEGIADAILERYNVVRKATPSSTASYTPTTDEVREAVEEWCWSRRMFRPELESCDGAEFDRWLTGLEVSR